MKINVGVENLAELNGILFRLLSYQGLFIHQLINPETKQERLNYSVPQQ
ncbi:MAG: hypothetical protein IPH84_03305 [Bacteroidales bacterium]|nr:hypothetical protein [Bacteroidales bacterium]